MSSLSAPCFWFEFEATLFQLIMHFVQLALAKLFATKSHRILGAHLPRFPLGLQADNVGAC